MLESPKAITMVYSINALLRQPMNWHTGPKDPSFPIIQSLSISKSYIQSRLYIIHIRGFFVVLVNVKVHALNWLIYHEMGVRIFLTMYVNKLIHYLPFFLAKKVIR